MIVTFYPDRDTDPTAFEKTVEACQRQIALGPKATAAFKREESRSRLNSRAGLPSSWAPRRPRAPFALPAHRGFTQLAIIREKEGKFDEALKLCQTAVKQGWNGDWEKRIARLEAKQTKKNGPTP